MTQVATVQSALAHRFLPDGRMLVTRVGPVWLVTQQGERTQVDNVPAVLAQGQGGMLGVFVSPHYATDQSIYLTYSEPGDGGRAWRSRARDVFLAAASRALKSCRCCGTTCRRGAADSSARRSPFHRTVSICSSPSAIGAHDPAQDPKHRGGQDPAADARRQAGTGQSNGWEDRRGDDSGSSIRHATRSGQDRARREHLHVPGRTLRRRKRDERASDAVRPGRSRRMGGCGKSSTAREARRAEPDRAWQEITVAASSPYAVNYDGVPNSHPDARPDLAKPVDLLDADHRAGQSHVLHRRDVSAVAGVRADGGGMATMTLNRITFDGKGSPRLPSGGVSDIGFATWKQGPDGALWMLEMRTQAGCSASRPSSRRASNGEEEIDRSSAPGKPQPARLHEPRPGALASAEGDAARSAARAGQGAERRTSATCASTSAGRRRARQADGLPGRLPLVGGHEACRRDRALYACARRVPRHGEIHIEYADGCVWSTRPPQIVAIEPGHDGWVVGNEPVVLIEFELRE